MASVGCVGNRMAVDLIESQAAEIARLKAFVGRVFQMDVPGYGFNREIVEMQLLDLPEGGEGVKS